MAGNRIKFLCVYCASTEGVSPNYAQAARELGRVAARRGISIVYGANRTGLMGALADAALQAGGEVIGVIPTVFNTPELVHAGLSRLEVVENIHQRKARLAELADAFVAMPGGLGTFEELFEILTWAQIGLHDKPTGLLNVSGYWDLVLDLIRKAAQEGFLYDQQKIQLAVAEEAGSLLDALEEGESSPRFVHWEGPRVSR